MSHLFREYAPFKGEIGGRRRGVMVSMESGVSTAYALNNIQERGRLFILARNRNSPYRRRLFPNGEALDGRPRGGVGGRETSIRRKLGTL